MSQLIAIAYPSELTAEKARVALLEHKKDLTLIPEDIVVVVRESDSGKVRLHQSVNLTTHGAVSGSFWGFLVGLLLASPLVGLGVGAATGAVVGHFTDIGIDDDFMKSLGKNLPKGGSALFVLARQVTWDRINETLKDFGGKVLHTNLSQEDENELKQKLESMQSAASEMDLRPQ